MIDLHTHSTASDGTLTPEALVELAAAKGIETLALTDHDTVAGLDRARAWGRKHGVEVIFGVELSCRWNGDGALHLLGYFIAADHPALRDCLVRLQVSRRARAQRIAEKLKALGKPVSFERVEEMARGGSLGRPHLAQAMLEAGHVSSLEQAFARYLSRGRPAFAEKDELDIGEAIALIRDAGGIAVLAHPGTLNLGTRRLGRTIEGFMAQGLEGVEVYWSGHSAEQIRRYELMAQNLNLLVTGGSDFHGANKPGVELGTGRQHNLRLPDSVLPALRTHHQRHRATPGSPAAERND